MDYPSTSGDNNTTKISLKSRVDSCFVPKCRTTSTKFPNKLFLTGPSDLILRKKWFQAAKKNGNYSPKTIIRCCEDHFDLENDVENWTKFKMCGGKLFLKKDVVPHIFECQNRMKPLKPRSAIMKRKRREILENIENTPGKGNRLMKRQKRQHGDQPGSYHPALSDAADDIGSSYDDNFQGPPPLPQLNLHTAQMCRVCLVLDVKMFDLRDTELKSMFQFTTGITFEENKGSKLGSLICWECAARLKAASKFRSKALFSESLLKGALTNKGEQIQEQYFEAAKEAESLITPTTLAFSGTVHIVEIDGQNNMTQLVQSRDDDEPSLSENDETEIKDEINDEHSEMDLDEDFNVAIKTEIDDNPTCLFSEEQNETKIPKEYSLYSTSSIEESINSGSGYSCPLLDIGHTSLQSDLTSPLEDYEDQISKHFITNMPIQMCNTCINTYPNQMSKTSIKNDPIQISKTCIKTNPNQMSKTSIKNDPIQMSKTCIKTNPNQISKTCIKNNPNQMSKTRLKTNPNQMSKTCMKSDPNKTSKTCLKTNPNQMSKTCKKTGPNQISKTCLKTNPNQMSKTCMKSDPNQTSKTCLKTVAKSKVVRNQNIELKLKRSKAGPSHDHTYSKGDSEVAKRRKKKRKWFRKKVSTQKVHTSSVATD